MNVVLQEVEFIFDKLNEVTIARIHGGDLFYRCAANNSWLYIAPNPRYQQNVEPSDTPMPTFVTNGSLNFSISIDKLEELYQTYILNCVTSP
jgi:hypothetical protein